MQKLNELRTEIEISLYMRHSIVHPFLDLSARPALSLIESLGWLLS